MSTVEPCSSCKARPSGHGHFALYCEPCSELPYGHSAPVFFECQVDGCGQIHEGSFSHEGLYGEGPIFAVACTDLLTSYYTAELLAPSPAPAAPLGLTFLNGATA